jgi:hypothetical protein
MTFASDYNGGTLAAAHRTAAALAGLLAATTLVILGLLHALSPEFDPSWRMVSEYANGSYGWLLSAMFVCWALSTWLLAYALWPLAHTFAAKLGVLILVIAGLGEAMAAAFDINHPLHMVAAILGMNGLPIAAMLIAVSFGRMGHWREQRRPILWLSNLTWISVVLMSIAMAMFFSELSRAGVQMTPDAKPLTELPPGVTAFGGWANRFLIVVYCAWAIAVAASIRKPAPA